MTISRDIDTCPLWFTLHLDASCSRDDRTGPDDLKVRWDYDADGEWDSEFLRIDSQTRFTIGDRVRSASAWSVRAEVVDLAGNASVLVTPVEFEDLPVAPDIVASALTFGTRYRTKVEEVRVGEKFGATIHRQCWGIPADQMIEYDFFRNDSLVYSSRGQCGEALCVGGGYSGFVENEPGLYEYKIVIDPSDLIVESEENNNSAKGSIRVVSQ